MHGARDPRVSLTEARRVFEAVPGPKKFVTFEQSGHESYLRTNASQWRTVIEGFIKRAENKDPDRYVSRDEDAG